MQPDYSPHTRAHCLRPQGATAERLTCYQHSKVGQLYPTLTVHLSASPLYSITYECDLLGAFPAQSANAFDIRRRELNPEGMTAEPIAPMVDPAYITTAFELQGYRIVSHRGVARGIVVRSRSAVGNFAAGIQAFFGGNITIYTELCEQARQEAFDLLRRHAAEAGANAIIGMKYDANDVAPGITEVLAYGTAVVVEVDPEYAARMQRSSGMPS